MPTLDVFVGDGYSCAELSDAMDLLPYVPNRLGAMNLFQKKSVATTVVQVEERNGQLALIPTSPRGGPGVALNQRGRKLRTFEVPHIKIEDSIKAGDSQNVRSFGTGNQLEAPAEMLNDKMEDAKQSMEATKEWHRMGALHGVLLDADGSSVIYNYFTEFGITEQVENFDFTANSGVGQSVINAKRKVENALGGTPFSGVHCIAGDQWFDAFVAHDEVKSAYDRWQNGAYLRNDVRDGFEYKGVFFENYRGQIGNVPFINTAKARFFPVGAPGIFKRYYAPADYQETVNTLGREYYVKTELMKMGRGVDIEMQTNPLFLPNRPRCLVEGTGTFS